jgi:hypothetical protein
VIPAFLVIERLRVCVEPALQTDCKRVLVFKTVSQNNKTQHQKYLEDKQTMETNRKQHNRQAVVVAAVLAHNCRVWLQNFFKKRPKTRNIAVPFHS